MARKKKMPSIVINTKESQRSQESISEQMDELSQALAKLSKAFLSNWTNDFQSQFGQIIQSLQKIVEPVQEDAKLAAPLLAKAKFWVTPSMPLGLLREIGQLAEKDIATSENVETFIVGYYEQNSWLNLKKAVKVWGKNELFAKRMFIIKDALGAHVSRKYTLSIPALLPQVEGLLSSIIKQPAGHPTRIFKNAIEKEYTNFLSSASKDILLDMATSPILYGGIADDYFTAERFPDWLAQKNLKEEQLFNRAAILHGVQINYATKANSLRVFLLLDSVYLITQKS